MATFTSLFSFGGATGASSPIGALVGGAGGDIFGAALGDGGQGVVYKIAALDGGGYSTTVSIVADLAALGMGPVVDLTRGPDGGLFVLAGDQTSGYATVLEIPYLGTGSYGAPVVLARHDATSPAFGRQIALDGTGDVFYATSDAGGLAMLREIAWTGAGYDASVSLGALPDGASVGGLSVDHFGDVFVSASFPSGDGSVFVARSADGYALATLAGLPGGAPAGDPAIDSSGDVFVASTSGGVGYGAIYEIPFGAGAASVVAAFTVPAGAGFYPSGVIVDGRGDLFGVTQSGAAGGVGALFEVPSDGAGGYGPPVRLASLQTPFATPIADANDRLIAVAPSGAGGPGAIYTSSDSGFTNACYVEGTLIRADSGDRRIETLTAGDLVLTDEGLEPIVWMGFRTVDCRAHPAPRKVWPYRVAAGALGPDAPARDLWVSPGHAVALDLDGVEHLVRIEALANGSTIRQVAVDRVTYWHVELARHAVILANGARAESYLDTGNRAGFANARRTTLFADFAPGPAHTTADYCRPYVDDGARLACARDAVAARVAALGWRRRPVRPDLHLFVDGRRIEPTETVGPWALFRLPADTRDVRLRSATHVPREMDADADGRPHGVLVRGLAVQDRDGRRDVALDDLACDGFHEPARAADGAGRWTDGDARLPASLWAGTSGPIALHVKTWSSPDARRWVPPPSVTVSRVA